MRVAVTGASGLLGLAILRQHRSDCRLLALTHRQRLRPDGFDVAAVDLDDGEHLRRTLRAFSPDWVVHAAAATDVEWCESQPSAAHRTNVELAGSVARATADVQARLLLISTDSVYDGPGPHDETSPTMPCNVYARTKLAAEQLVARIDASALIARVNFVGWRSDGRGLLGWAVRELRAGHRIQGWADVWFSPLSAPDLADACVDMMKRELTGLYCVGGADGLTKLDFLRAVGREWGFGADRIGACVMGDAGARAARPRDTRLRSARAETALGRPLRGIVSALRPLKAEELATRSFFATVLPAGEMEA